MQLFKHHSYKIRVYSGLSFTDVSVADIPVVVERYSFHLHVGDDSICTSDDISYSANLMSSVFNYVKYFQSSRPDCVYLFCDVLNP